MGNAAATLTPLQTAEVTRQLKIEYEKCIEKGLDSDAATAMMTKKYDAVLKAVQASPLAIITSNAKRLQRGTSKAVESKQKRKSFDSKSSAPSRHKSFDEKPVKPENRIKKGTESALEQSGSAPVVGSASEKEDEKAQQKEPPTDSWDSVKGQPACVLCGMVFTSVDKLNTHTKYSSLHASNLKKLEEKSTVGGEPEELNMADPSARCRVVYTGSKFFWRTKETIDIHIYLHINEKCIELIGYHTESATELPRIYISENHLVSVIGAANIEEKVLSRKEADKIEDMAGKEHVSQLIFEEEKRLLIASLLVSRLQMDSVTQDGMIVKGVILGSSGVGEAIEVLPSRPEGLVPVRIKRRRHSSSDEINASMRTLSDMQNDLKNLTANAEKLVESINAGVKAFKGAMTVHESEEEVSEVKKRWRQAINKIIVRNGVANTTDHLKKFGEKYIPANFGR